MIPTETIDKIFNSMDIVDIVKDYIKLDKKGADWKACCPFHTEKTPSFSVTPKKQIYKCFGCGEAGNGVSFVMKMDNISYPEALKKIAKKYQITIEEEELTPEKKAEIKLSDSVKEFYQAIMEQYHMELFLPANKDALNYLLKRFTEVEIRTFKLGWVPKQWNYLSNWAVKHGYSNTLMEESGLFRKRDKDGSFYDFFRGRIIFPFFNKYGQCTGFNGRDKDYKKNESKRNDKYINLSDTPVFKKDEAIYGINLAIGEIRNTELVYIVEGQTDVIRMHQKNMLNTVAASGTALTISQAKILKTITNFAHLVYDGDNAGVKAAHKNGKILLKVGFFVTISFLPKEEDPDSFFKKTDPKEWINDNMEDYILTMANQDIEKTKNNPAKKAQAIKRIGEMLSYIKDKETQTSYINDLMKGFKKLNINKTQLINACKTEASEEEKKAVEIDIEGLPAYLSNEEKKEFSKYGFYESKEGVDKNQYFFGPHRRLSNFIMKPLYHIISINNTRKLFELVNKYGKRQIIEIDMMEITSLTKFRTAVESRGNFLFEGGDRELIKLRRKLYDKTKYCYAIENLGWQKAGFWAWANGITTIDGKFQGIDEFGIVNYTIKNPETEDQEVRNYFIPAFSAIYIDDQSIFHDERKFKFAEGEVKWNTWIDLFVKVYQKQAIMSIAFYITSLFSDYIFQYLDNLPLLNYFGVKGSGKNEQAMSIVSLFGEQQKELQLNNATKAGIAAHLDQFNNNIAWFDEYKNEVPYDIIETLKGIYNRNGRTRGSIKIGVKKETTPINSMAIITGQEMLTADIALFSRVILLSYNIVVRNPKTVQLFNELKEMQKEGLSHFTHQLLKYRDIIKHSYPAEFKTLQSEFNDYFKNQNIEERIIKNYVTVLTTLKILSPIIHLPFDWGEIEEIAKELIIDQNEQVSSSNELGQFWRVFASLFDGGIIKHGNHFKLMHVDHVNTIIPNKDKDYAKQNPEKYVLRFDPPKEIVMIRWVNIYMLYAKASRDSGQKALPESTLKFYLRTSRAFICKARNVRFSHSITDPYVFDYPKLNINLTYFDNEEDGPQGETLEDKSPGYEPWNKQEYKNEIPD